MEDKLKARLDKHLDEITMLSQFAQQLAGSISEIKHLLEDDSVLLSDEDRERYKKKHQDLLQEYAENNAKRNDILGRIRVVEEMVAIRSM